MKYFKSEIGEVFAFEKDGSQDSFIREDLIPISFEEMSAIQEAIAASTAPSHEEILKAANDTRDGLLAAVALRIAPLQDAADLEMATSEELATLKLWKQYRIALSRVVSQPTYPSSIDWPTQPAK